MPDNLSWFKHRVDAVAIPWLAFTIYSFATMRGMNIAIFIVAWIYILPIPVLVQLYRIYYCCSAWQAKEAAILRRENGA
jgi:hypothetical protein